MSYNNKNKLQMIKKIQDIVQEHYVEDMTTYKGIWKKHVFPVYPCSYHTFLKYISTPVKKEDLV